MVRPELDALHRPTTHLCREYSPCQAGGLGESRMVAFPPLQCIPFRLGLVGRHPALTEPPVDLHLKWVGSGQGSLPPGP